MANKKTRSRLELRLEQRQREFPAKIAWIGIALLAAFFSAALVYAAYNEWFRLPPAITH